MSPAFPSFLPFLSIFLPSRSQMNLNLLPHQYHQNTHADETRVQRLLFMNHDSVSSSNVALTLRTVWDLR